MIVRKIELHDLDAVAKMTAENFIDSWTFDMIKSSYQTEGFLGLIAEDNGEILSVCSFGGVLDERELYFVVTKKSARGMGIARTLLQKAFDALSADGVKTCFLEVRESNSSAIKLYKSLGFVNIAERKNYYGMETAIIMQKSL